MNTGQRALLRAARACIHEAARANRLGQRRYAALLRADARKALARATVEGSDHLVNAIECVKKACALAEGLPARDADADSHDECVKTMHGEVQSGRSYLEQHLNPAGLPSKTPRSWRRRGSGSGTPASATDDNQPYEPVSGDSNLLRALDSLQKADIESDHLVDVMDDENERDRSAGSLHFHTKSADDSLQAYRDAVTNNPEQEKRRGVARAWAQTIATALH
jgi:hypothetical protein